MVSSVRRIIALWLPRLATDRIRRGWKISPPPDAILPLVLVAKIDNAMRLTAVDAKAARLGLSTGMALASARAMPAKLLSSGFHFSTPLVNEALKNALA